MSASALLSAKVYDASNRLIGSAKFRFRNADMSARWWNGLLFEPDFDVASLPRGEWMTIAFSERQAVEGLVLDIFTHNEFDVPVSVYVAGIGAPPRLAHLQDPAAA